MRLATLSLHRFKVSGLVVSAVIATLIMATTASGLWGQTPQLSLADLLIGLRSKKVTLQERNRILAEAVRQRGITFSMSGEIEKELATTGADKELIEAIKHKDAPEKQTAIAKQPADNARAAVPQPVATPTPPDFSFYKSRADVSALKGDFTSALTDYSKSIELKPDNTVVLFSRGQTYFNLRSYDQSVTDFNRVLELNPRDSMAFTNRAMSYEKLGDTNKAMADYQKAVDLDGTNESAKAALKRMRDEQARLAAAKMPPSTTQPVTAQTSATTAATVPAPALEQPKVPEFISMGALSAANAIRMAMPVYSMVAQKSNIEGRVTVEVTIDESGEVIEAKATTGHALLRSSAEDAAARSKFKPAMFNGKPLKGKGTIVYNFSLRQGR